MVLCLIVGCGNKMGKIWPTAEKVSFFRVEMLLSTKEELTVKRRIKWSYAISREDLTDLILENDRDCNKYLVSGEPAKDWYCFNADWLPTLCLGHSKLQMQVKDHEAAEVWSRRAAERQKRRSELLENAIKDEMLKIDELGKTTEEIPIFRVGGAG